MDTNLTRHFLALLARFLSGASVRWIDSQPDTCQRVYFANHTSHMDAIVIWSSLPRPVRALTRPVAAKDYWMGGPIRRHLANRVFNAILIEREPEYLEDIARRMELAVNPSKRAAVAKTKNKIDDLGPLFADREAAE